MPYLKFKQRLEKRWKASWGYIHVAGNGWYSHIATCYDCCPSHRPWRCWEAQLTNHENHRNRNVMWHNWHRFSETTTRALWQTHIFHQGGISTHHLGFRPSQSPPKQFCAHRLLFLHIRKSGLFHNRVICPVASGSGSFNPSPTFRIRVVQPFHCQVTCGEDFPSMPSSFPKITSNG